MSSPKAPQHASTERHRGRRELDQCARTNKLSVLLTDAEVEELDQWRHERNLLTRSNAIRRLMRLGFESKADERAYG
jgi:hypothetical protein